jgi:hypothetical protein
VASVSFLEFVKNVNKIHNTLTGKKNGTLISQQQIIPIIPILMMYFDNDSKHNLEH